MTALVVGGGCAHSPAGVDVQHIPAVSPLTLVAAKAQRQLQRLRGLMHANWCDGQCEKL